MDDHGRPWMGMRIGTGDCMVAIGVGMHEEHVECQRQCPNQTHVEGDARSGGDVEPHRSCRLPSQVPPPRPSAVFGSSARGRLSWRTPGAGAALASVLGALHSSASATRRSGSCRAGGERQGRRGECDRGARLPAVRPPMPPPPGSVFVADHRGRAFPSARCMPGALRLVQASAVVAAAGTARPPVPPHPAHPLTPSGT